MDTILEYSNLDGQKIEKYKIDLEKNIIKIGTNYWVENDVSIIIDICKNKWFNL